MIFVRRTTALLWLMAMVAACDSTPTSQVMPPSGAGTLAPWEPADEAFRGCEGGCGLRLTAAASDAVVQPGGRLGQRTYCPVSGVVFEVKEASSHRDVDGRPIYTCCETCALYFDANRERLLALRGLESL